MDIRSGRLLTDKQAQALRDRGLGQYVGRVRVPATAEQLRRGKIGRNDPCPCGSGKKFKKCCRYVQPPGGERA